MDIPYKALVFDFDGTLIDSAPDIARTVNRTLDHHGRRQLSLEEVRGMIGDGARALLRQAFAATGEPLDEASLPPVYGQFIDFYVEEAETPSPPYPGVEATLRALHGAGVRLGLCTNKPERVTRVLLDRMGLAPLFVAVAGGDTLPFRKPDGRHPAWVLEAMGGTAAEAALVGDNAHDVSAAHAAGLPAVIMSYGYPRMPLERLGADLILDRFEDLPEGLRRLARQGPRASVT